MAAGVRGGGDDVRGWGGGDSGRSSRWTFGGGDARGGESGVYLEYATDIYGAGFAVALQRLVAERWGERGWGRRFGAGGGSGGIGDSEFIAVRVWDGLGESGAGEFAAGGGAGDWGRGDGGVSLSEFCVAAGRGGVAVCGGEFGGFAGMGRVGSTRDRGDGFAGGWAGAGDGAG